MDMLTVSNLSLSFGGLQVLSDVSFNVNQGEVFAIIGPNGAGKTSILNSISGFYRPEKGRIALKGLDVSRFPADRRAALGLGRTFQNIALYRGMSVLDNIKLGAHVHLQTGLLSSQRLKRNCDPKPQASVPVPMNIISQKAFWPLWKNGIRNSIQHDNNSRPI